MARRRRGDEPADDLSVGELIDGPTEILTPQIRAAALAGPSGSGGDLEATHDLSGLAPTGGDSDPAAVDPAGTSQAGTRAAGGGDPAGTATGSGDPAARARVELSRLPAAGPLYRRALLNAVPGLGGRRGAGVPAVELAVTGVPVDPERLADYDRVCGFRLADRLPATFPHVMGFPLALRLITAPEFPIPLTGVVHVGNRITVRRPVTVTDRLDFATWAENLRPHDRGRQVDVVLVGSVDGEEVWRGVSTYLGRQRTPGGGERRDHGERPAPPAATARWPVTPGSVRTTRGSPATTTRSTPRGWGRGCSASPSPSHMACGARHGVSRRWRAGCPRRTRWMWRSSCPCRCPALWRSAPRRSPRAGISACTTGVAARIWWAPSAERGRVLARPPFSARFFSGRDIL
ncbi:hypothetical protein GCM10029963_44750 [Micromonospora andamanensis]